MKKTFLAAALACGLCLPTYAAQFTNDDSQRYDAPVFADEEQENIKPNEAVEPKKLNRCRDKAFEDLCRIGIPDRMVERYKYSDIPELFKPDYGVNIKRLDVPVDPYKAFKCDVPNLSTSLYFIVNDCFYDKVTSRVNLPEGVTVGSLKQYAETNPDIVGRYYSQLADTSEDGVTAINTMLAQDGLVVHFGILGINIHFFKIQIGKNICR